MQRSIPALGGLESIHGAVGPQDYALRNGLCLTSQLILVTHVIFQYNATVPSLTVTIADDEVDTWAGGLLIYTVCNCHQGAVLSYMSASGLHSQNLSIILQDYPMPG